MTGSKGYSSQAKTLVSYVRSLKNKALQKVKFFLKVNIDYSAIRTCLTWNFSQNKSDDLINQKDQQKVQLQKMSQIDLQKGYCK